MNTKTCMAACPHTAVKRIVSLILSITMLFSITAGLGFSAYAETYSSTCGKNVTWSLDENTGKLTISGSGAMDDYSSYSSVPWSSHRFAIKSVDIGNGVKSIGDAAFSNCINLTSVTIPNSVTSIGNYAFSNCNSLISITIPNSVRSIGHQAFECCSYLTNVTIPNSIKSIDDAIFYRCTRLTSVTIPNSVTSIGRCAFFDCIDLKDIYYGGTKEQWNNIFIGEKNEYLTKATIHYNSSGIDDNKIFKDFKVGNHNFKDEFGYCFSDDYFNDSAENYNHHLATMSLCLALSTYQTTKITDENVKSVMTGCGFKEYQQYNYKTTPTRNSIACAVSNKTIDGNTVIAIAVRSGGYGAEWSGNATVGLAGDHQGFDVAANQVVNYITDYIAEKGIAGNIKIWIVGYSRGAATATQAAAKLNKLKIDNVSFDSSKIYAYGFATPAGAIKSSNPHSNNYNNIFNIIHYHDFVPLVAPSSWNFERYGTTKVLPFYESSVRTSPYEKAMKNYLSKMGYKFELDDFETTVYNHDSLGTFSRKFVKTIANNIGGRLPYNNLYQAELQNILSKSETGKYLGIADELFSQDLIKMLLREGVFHPYLTAVAIYNKDLLVEAHDKDGAYYLAWMQSMDSNYVEGATPYFTNGDYRAVKVNCPVNVFVYDESNNLVASIVNEIPQDIENSSIISSIDENGQKIVYLPCDAEYRVEVIARENCETTYTVNECTGADSDICRIVNYEEVSMTKNEKLTSAIDSYSDELIENGAENGTDLLYNTELSNKNLKPDLDVSGDAIEQYTYTIDVSFDENEGTVIGGGVYTEGDFCQLTALNNVGYSFEGWYIDDVKISSDCTYRFAVKESINIEAHYTICEHSSYDTNVVNSTCTKMGYTTYTCSTCGYSYEGNYVDKLGHSFSYYMVDGTKVRICDVCGYKFIDLDVYETYIDHVMYTSVYNEFLKGTNPPANNVFAPARAIDRAMMVTILYRMAGEPYANGGNPYASSPFTDITNTSVYYYDAACWALKNGVTTETTFKPFNNVTREQTATFLYRYAQDNDKLGDADYKNVNLNTYHDGNSVSHFAVDAMKWANYNGMITGTEQGYANPQGATQRIHATKILYGFGKVCNIGNFE